MRMLTSRRSRYFFILVVAISVSAFLLWASFKQHPAERLMDDYLTRLARVLKQDKPPVSRTSLPRMAPHAELHQNLEPIKIDLLDYWAFRECGLTPLLSERNSVLGRVMLPSQHLHMDGRILQQLAHCQRQLKDEELLALAKSLLIAKQAQWPGRYWNASLAAPELRRFWSPATEPLIPGREASYTQAEAALRQLQALPQLLADAQWPNQPELEAHYQQLDAYQLGGKLLQSLQLASDSLRTANQLMATATEQASLCPYGKPLKELDYARNLMQKIFIGEVQPWLAALNQRASQLLPAYRDLLAQQDKQLQPLMTPFVTELEELYGNFLQQNRQHVASWKALFTRCGSQPITPTTINREPPDE